MKETVDRAVFAVLAVLPSLMGAASYFFLPERVPVHFAFDGSVDRYGGRLEAALLGSVSLLLCASFLITIAVSKRSEQPQNIDVIYTYASFVEFVFAGFYAFYLYMIFTNGDGMFSGDLLVRFLFAELGLVWIFGGNIMPKIRRNGFIGVRTKDSMKNDAVWKKSQRFSGIMGIVIGIVMIVTALAVSGESCVVLCITLVMIYAIVCTVYAKFAAMNDNSEVL